MHHRSAREVPPLDLACLDQEHVGAATYSRHVSHVSHVSHVHDGNPVCRRFRRLHSFALRSWLEARTAVPCSRARSLAPAAPNAWAQVVPRVPQLHPLLAAGCSGNLNRAASATGNSMWLDVVEVCCARCTGLPVLLHVARKNYAVVAHPQVLRRALDCLEQELARSGELVLRERVSMHGTCRKFFKLHRFAVWRLGTQEGSRHAPTLPTSSNDAEALQRAPACSAQEHMGAQCTATARAAGHRVFLTQ